MASHGRAVVATCGRAVVAAHGRAVAANVGISGVLQGRRPLFTREPGRAREQPTWGGFRWTQPGIGRAE